MFSAGLVNDPFGDPVTYVEFLFRGEAILFDLGDIHSLPPRKILKVNAIFVSHTHMDHFIGFDHFLRLCLGREKQVRLFGPPGFNDNVLGKINSYTWNLIENYTNNLDIYVTEVHDSRKETFRYRLQNSFRPEKIGEQEMCDGILLEGEFYKVKGISLDHKIPCLAFALEEKARVNIKTTGLIEMGLPTGQWLLDLKRKVLGNEPDDTPVRIWSRRDGSGYEGERSLGELKEKLVLISSGEKISYVTDVLYNDENCRRIIDFVRGSELLFIESTFLDEDSRRAREKYHLTARQAGDLARKSGVKRIVLFHFSPKYQKNGNMLEEEALRAFKGEGA
ncbi:MAG: MBL fold metallo-hydrolase [Syntrophaceae bacterium]